MPLAAIDRGGGAFGGQSKILVFFIYTKNSKANYRQSDQVLDWHVRKSAAGEHSGGRNWILQLLQVRIFPIGNFQVKVSLFENKILPYSLIKIAFNKD